MRTIVLLHVLVAFCRAANPAAVLYDAGCNKWPLNQRILAEILIRELGLEYRVPSLISNVIRPRQRANMTAVQNFILLTNRRSSIDNLKELPTKIETGSLIWWLNIEPPCSRSFRLLKPRRSVLEDLQNLIDDSRSVKKSILQESSGTCSRSQWEKQTVIAGTTDISPCVIRSELGGIAIWNGTNIELFEIIAKSIGFKYVFIEPADRFVGLPGNETVGLVGMALRDEFDIAVYANVFSSQIYFDVVWPTIFGHWVLWIPAPMVVYDLFSNAKPFGSDVWMCVIASILSVSLSMWVVTKMSGKQSDLGLDVLYNLSLVTGQGGFNPKYLPGRFLATAWNLGAFIIVFSYTSILISFVTARQPQPLMKSLEDFVTKGTLKPVAVEGYIFSTVFLVATSGFQKEIGNLFRKNHESLVKTNEEAMQMVIGGRYGYITGEGLGESSLYSDFKSTKKCRITIMELQGSGFILSGWNTSKAVPALTQILNKGVLSATEGGLLNYLERKYNPRINCFSLSNLGEAPKESPLVLIQLQTAFLILGLGIVLSVLSFVREIAWPLIRTKI